MGYNLSLPADMEKIVEKKKIALSSRDAEGYAQACLDLGVEPEDSMLYEHGLADMGLFDESVRVSIGANGLLMRNRSDELLEHKLGVGNSDYFEYQERQRAMRSNGVWD